jgi:hypothetical protein
MRTTIPAAITFALALTTLGNATYAQAEPSPAPSALPSSSPAAEVTPDAGPTDALAFAEPRWRQLRPGRSPAGREDHTWTVDADGRYAYLYGGRDGARELDDLWRYDLRRDRWRRVTPRGRGPGARFGHSAVWVEGTGLVVFAGQRGVRFFDDLWAFDPERRRWQQLPSRGSVPKARYGSCMVVGRDGRLWISHGFTTTGRFDDTRAYNLRSRRWATLTPDGRKPGERCLHDCFTTMAGELVLYGGQDDGAFALDDLWSMGRDRTWTRHDDPAPAARRLYAVTEAADHAYVFGGAGQDNGALADLWRVDRESLRFERVRPAGNGPSARYAGTLITDHERGRLLLFGGQGSSAMSDVWELVDGAADEPVSSSPVPTSAAASDAVEGDGPSPSPAPTPPAD